MHAVRWLASPRQGECFLRGRKALLNDFWYFWSHKSTIRKKYLYVSSRETTGLPYYQNPNFINSQSKRLNPHSLFLLHMQAQKKKLSKRKRRGRDFALCGARQELRALDGAAFPKRRAKTLLCSAKVLIAGEVFGLHFFSIPLWDR